MGHSEANHFIFVAVDGESVDGAKVSANVIAKARISKQVWPLYKNTRHRKIIGSGDSVLIYIGGTGNLAQHVIVAARVSSVKQFRARIDAIDAANLLTEHPSLVVSLTDTSLFNQPVSMRFALPKLDCCPANIARWGSILQGGIKKITRHDFAVLTQLGGLR